MEEDVVFTVSTLHKHIVLTVGLKYLTGVCVRACVRVCVRMYLVARVAHTCNVTLLHVILIIISH